jgi:hypothetical protein
MIALYLQKINRGLSKLLFVFYIYEVSNDQINIQQRFIYTNEKQVRNKTIKNILQ